MSEFTYGRLRGNLERLKRKNTPEILDNSLERALKENTNVVEILDCIFSEKAKNKNRRAIDKQIQMSGFPVKKDFNEFDFGSQPSIDKRHVEELRTMRFLENAENVVFFASSLRRLAERFDPIQMLEKHHFYQRHRVYRGAAVVLAVEALYHLINFAKGAPREPDYPDMRILWDTLNLLGAGAFSLPSLLSQKGRLMATFFDSLDRLY